MDARAGSRADRVAGVSSNDIVNAVRYIVAGDGGGYYLLALLGDRPLYIYSIRYEPAGYSILGRRRFGSKIRSFPDGDLPVLLRLDSVSERGFCGGICRLRHSIVV